MEYCVLGGDVFVNVLKQKNKPSKIRIQKSLRKADNVKGGRLVRMKNLVSLTPVQFKSLVASKKTVLAALRPPPLKVDLVQQALDIAGVKLQQEKSSCDRNDAWNSLVKGEAPQGCATSSWMEQLWGEEKKKKKKSNSTTTTTIPNIIIYWFRHSYQHRKTTSPCL